MLEPRYRKESKMKWSKEWKEWIKFSDGVVSLLRKGEHSLFWDAIRNGRKDYPSDLVDSDIIDPVWFFLLDMVELHPLRSIKYLRNKFDHRPRGFHNAVTPNCCWHYALPFCDFCPFIRSSGCKAEKYMELYERYREGSDDKKIRSIANEIFWDMMRKYKRLFRVCTKVVEASNKSVGEGGKDARTSLQAL